MNPRQISTFFAAFLLTLEGCGDRPPASPVADALRWCRSPEESRLKGISFAASGKKGCAPEYRSEVHTLEGTDKKYADAVGLWLSSEIDRPASGNRSASEPSAEVQKAIDVLEELVRARPGDVGPANDLASIYYSAAALFDRPTYLLRAAELLAPHLRRPRLPDEALWNGALLFEALGLPEAARDAWRRFLEQDRSSEWVPEAERHLELLAALPAPAKRGRTFPFVRRKPLPDGAGARERLQSFVSQLARSLPGDALNAEAAALAAETLRRGDEAEIARLAELHEKLEKGYLGYRENSPAAPALLETARQGFAAAENPLSLWAEYCLALVDQASDRLSAGRERFEDLASRLAGSRYPELADHLDWMRGLVLYRLGRPLEALAPYRRSLDGFTRRSDAENAATVETLVGETLFSLGQDEEAWSHLLAESHRRFLIRDSRRALIRSLIRANAARDAGFREVAALYGEQALERARALENLGHIAIAATGLIRLEIELGNLERAQSVLEGTLALIDLGDKTQQDRPLADLAPLRAALDRQGPLAGRIALLDAAIAYYRLDPSSTSEVNNALESRAELHRENGDRPRAMADLDESLRLYEGRLATPGAAEVGTSAGRPAQAAYRRAIGWSLEEGRTEEAYALAIRAREATLSSFDTPRFAGSGLEPLPLDPGWALAHWVLLEDRVAIFVRSESGILALRSPLGPEEVRQRVGRLRARLAASHSAADAKIRSEARELHAALLDPIDEALGGRFHLLLVAEEELGTLPFAALENPATGRFALEERGLLHVPSESMYRQALQRGQDWRLAGKKVALADPSFDRSLWPDLAALDGALEEGRAARRVFGDLHLFHGAGATRAALRREARDASFLLIAAHSITSPRSAARSVLLLAGSPDEPGAFYQKDIYQLELEKSPLVVLSACGSGKPTGEEAPPSSIANGFLAAGASLVIAPLFDVNDQKTTELMTLFYQQLAQGRAPAEALRQAQLSYLADSRATRQDPWLWAFFEAHGASR